MYSIGYIHIYALYINTAKFDDHMTTLKKSFIDAHSQLKKHDQTHDHT